VVAPALVRAVVTAVAYAVSYAAILFTTGTLSVGERRALTLRRAALTQEPERA
jgi:hypothetical protein